jgi:hypothetical protein
MNNQDIPRFKQAVHQHFALYPGKKLQETTVGNWFNELMDYPIDCVVGAFYQARKNTDARFMPNCQEVRQYAKIAFKQNQSKQMHQSAANKHVADAPQNLKKLDPENKFEKLARYWEQENSYWQMHPEKRPQDPGKARLKQFWKVWGGN